MRCFDRRTIWIVAAILPLLFLFAPTDAARAQNAPKTAASMQLQSCHKVCFTEGEKCVTQPNGKEPFCNTLEIGCVSACAACIGGFSACSNNEDRTPRFCQTTFDTCLEQKLDASRARARPQIAFNGGDGLTQQTAIVIDGALGEFEGIMAENLWVARHHPQWRKHDQALIAADGKHFDKIGYDAPDGAHTVWYDVSGFLGK